MHKALYSRDDVRKERRKFTNTEVCVDATIQRLKDWIKKSKERLIITSIIVT